MPLPNWLPEMLEIEPWCEASVGILYAQFARDFKGVNLTLEGLPVRYFPHLEEDGMEAIFWHLVQKECRESGMRVPDYDRCSRLPWIAAVISNSNQPEVTKWEYLEARGHMQTYLWLREFDYVVILRKFKNGQGRNLITAHCVEGNGTRRTLQSKLERGISSK